MSASTVYGLGNRCSDNDENRKSGVIFHCGVQRVIDLTPEVKVKGQMCGERFSGIEKIVYHWSICAAKNMAVSDLTSEVKVRGQF